MRTNFSKKQLAVACALALGIVSGTATAQGLGPVSDHALVTTTGGQVWMNGFGDCWHSTYGPPPAPNFPCGPQPIAQYVAPYVAPAAAPAPYVAPYVAPAPAPIFVAAAAPQPVYEKVTLDADTLFDFDKSVLRPAGRDALDAFMKNIQGINPSTIVAVGHTDRLGTNRYNQDLSERRVASVKTYLVGKGIASKPALESGDPRLCSPPGCRRTARAAALPWGRHGPIGTDRSRRASGSPPPVGTGCWRGA